MSSETTREISVKEAMKELRRVRKLRRRGMLAPYRLAVALVTAALIAGPELVSTASGDPSRAALRFAAGALLGWTAWGVVDSVLASTQRRVDADERRERRRAREEAQAAEASSTEL